MSNQQAIVRRLLDSGMDFALYRFPLESEPQLVLQTRGQARILSTEDEHEASFHPFHHSFTVDTDEGISGFVFAPFANSKRTPTLLIRPDVAVGGWGAIDIETQSLGHKRSSLSSIPVEARVECIDESDSYKGAFRTFRNQLDKEEYQKLVLSYSQLDKWAYAGHEDELFVKALDLFPRSMVYLIYTRTGGRWFGCTPELLVEGYGRKWKTMALAGTMPADSAIEWSQKDVHEQELVSQYIEGQLQQLHARVIRRGPYTAQAGLLKHLRTDFIFHTPTAMRPMDIITMLHPTPAVCGLPKDEAWRFIRLFERNQRMYYGGYLGPLNLRAETNIFVNIRCCNIRPAGKAIFFAGGGLTRDSRFWSEKEEVKRKLETLKSIR